VTIARSSELPLAVVVSFLVACTGTISDVNPGENTSGGHTGTGGSAPASSGAPAASGGSGTGMSSGGATGGAAPTPGGAGGSSQSGGASNGGSGATSNCTAAAALPKARVWRLTSSQLENTLRDQFGFVPPSLQSLPMDARLDGFANQASKLTIAPLLAETYFAMGVELGARAAADPQKFGIACEVASLKAGSCLDGFLSTVGKKMWRRPLTPAEVSSFATLFTTTAAQGDGPAGGVASVVQALFLSPNFLHRTELGTVAQAGAVTPLTHYEIASSLSYLLWDTAPDDELLQLAAQEKLRDRDVILAQARRLFESRAKSAPAVDNFLRQWLHLENLETAVKDVATFPGATDQVLSDLSQELQLFTDSVFFSPGADRSFKTLFTANYTFVNERTAPFYGITGVTGAAMVRRELDAKQRRGVVSMVPFLWGHSNGEETNLVGRGAYFRGEVLCHRVPLPPGGVPPGNFAPPNSTGRQKLAAHANPACAGCHALFDGIGFALENYDAVGRYRTTDQGQTIDPTGTLPLPSEGNQLPGMPFSNFVELVDELAEKPDIYGCFARQFASYAAGRDIPELDTCEAARLEEQFAKSNYKLDELVLSVIGSTSFMDRKN
jgi:hypothetical protein